MDEFEQELKQDFLTEAVDLLSDAESAFLRLDSDAGDPELMNEIFRLAHNLKGTSKAVGFDQLSELTHKAENLILKIKEGEIGISDQVVSTLLEFKDTVDGMINELKDDLEKVFDVDAIQKKIDKMVSGELEDNQNLEPEPLVEESAEVLEEVTSGEDKKFDELQEVVSESIDESFSSEKENTLEQIPDASLFQDVIAEPEVQPEVLQKEEVQAEAERSSEPAAKGQKKESVDSDETIRVKLSRINTINNVVGELIILQTVINQRRFQYIQDDLTNKSIGMMGKLFKEVQELAMSLRMLPLKSTFQKMNRIVRDTSKALDKEVNLKMIGEETEVDKTVLEKLSDPLVHIVRNAIDHGLESTEGRKEAGKDPQGNVQILAYHEGSNLVIEVNDDGKGIDPEIIRKKAIEKKVIDEHTPMTPEETIQLIFHPGFSTKEQVTEVSGRGVGMDVVKTNIESLGGEVNLQSKVGEGSSFKVVLPLTLAIIEGLVITAEKEKFVIPLSQIFEIVKVQESEIENFSGIARLFKVRGEVLPLFHINSKLGKKLTPESQYTVIILRGSTYSFGVVVEDILNQQQIVIKKLGDDIPNKKGMMGSAIMADGMPAIILDFYELFKDDLNASRGYKNMKIKQSKAA